MAAVMSFMIGDVSLIIVVMSLTIVVMSFMLTIMSFMLTTVTLIMGDRSFAAEDIPLVLFELRGMTAEMKP